MASDGQRHVLAIGGFGAPREQDLRLPALIGHALEALAASAQRLGLNRRTALTAAAHALADGILSWREAGIPLDRLLHEAATPGGIAASVMKAMDSSGYQRSIRQGLRAGMERARKNAKRT